MANITPKSNGTYLIRISCGTDAAGEQISKSRVFKPSKPKLSYNKLNLETVTEFDAVVLCMNRMLGIRKERAEHRSARKRTGDMER